MKKGHWYRHLFEQLDNAIRDHYFFEASFISYGIIEDRLDSIMEELQLPRCQGVKAKITRISKRQHPALESEFGLSGWNGAMYTKKGLFADVIAWCEAYRNPMQHILGDPRTYHATVGNFHTDITQSLAEEGKIISRSLSSGVMRFKRRV